MELVARLSNSGLYDCKHRDAPAGSVQPFAIGLVLGGVYLLLPYARGRTMVSLAMQT